MTSGESTHPWPVLCRLWFHPPNLYPGKAFACSAKHLKNFYGPSLILGRNWQCLKRHLSFSLSDSKVLFFYLPKNLRIFVLQNSIYCITFLLYCSSSSKSLFLYSSSVNSLYLSACMTFRSSVATEEGRERGHIPPRETQSSLVLKPLSLMGWALSWIAFQMLEALCSSRRSWVCFFKSKVNY